MTSSVSSTVEPNLSNSMKRNITSIDAYQNRISFVSTPAENLYLFIHIVSGLITPRSTHSPYHKLKCGLGYTKKYRALFKAVSPSTVLRTIPGIVNLCDLYFIMEDTKIDEHTHIYIYIYIYIIYIYIYIYTYATVSQTPYLPGYLAWLLRKICKAWIKKEQSFVWDVYNSPIFL